MPPGIFAWKPTLLQRGDQLLQPAAVLLADAVADLGMFQGRARPLAGSP